MAKAVQRTEGVGTGADRHETPRNTCAPMHEPKGAHSNSHSRPATTNALQIARLITHQRTNEQTNKKKADEYRLCEESVQ